MLKSWQNALNVLYGQCWQKNLYSSLGTFFVNVEAIISLVVIFHSVQFRLTSTLFGNSSSPRSPSKAFPQPLVSPVCRIPSASDWKWLWLNGSLFPICHIILSSESYIEMLNRWNFGSLSNMKKSPSFAVVWSVVWHYDTLDHVIWRLMPWYEVLYGTMTR